ncbi:hypothetical protein DY000_02039850 [Brassica cretica]|uniref:Uncharacterized protein n=1 Tax=Brassica cretica TaxID=69181 RepID=A0ABQ7B6Y8_BRACR|nr:hypothetical protein DY000_02039850 [Brassica cretica]
MGFLLLNCKKDVNAAPIVSRGLLEGTDKSMRLTTCRMTSGISETGKFPIYSEWDVLDKIRETIPDKEKEILSFEPSQIKQLLSNGKK